MMEPPKYDRARYIEAVIATAAQQYRVRPAELILRRGRRKRVEAARLVAMAVAYETLPRTSMQTVGRYFDNRDHSTVWNAVHRLKPAVEKAAAANPASLSEWIERVRAAWESER
jgi:chromosomal replication initiation ATPase DnaA